MFHQSSRRQFVRGTLSTAVYRAFAEGGLQAYALGLPMGFQIYSVRKDAASDFLGVLKKTAAFGYKAVELCSFRGYTDFGPLQGMKPSEIRKTVEGAGLRCESSHFNSSAFSDETIDATVEWAKGIGLKFVILSMAKQKPEMTMDDWKQNFDLMNVYGEHVKKAGMQSGYHTHATEWKRLDNVLVFDALLKAVDPKLVQAQLDLSGIVMTGVDPASYLRDHLAVSIPFTPRMSKRVKPRRDLCHLGRATSTGRPCFRRQRQSASRITRSKWKSGHQLILSRL